MERVNERLIFDFGLEKEPGAARMPWEWDILGIPPAEYIRRAALEAGVEGYEGVTLIARGLAPLITPEQIRALAELHTQSGADFSICAGDGAALVIVRDALLEDVDISKPDAYDVTRAKASKTVGADPENPEDFVTLGDGLALARITEIMRRRVNESLMRSGVIIIDPARADISPSARIGSGSVICPGCVIEGETSIGRDCVVGMNTRITDMGIGNNVHIEASVLTGSTVGDGSHIGPFAYVRPGSYIGQNVKLGDFVEIKNAVIGDGTKVSHLTYVGDADVGGGVNFGCGCVTVNYDGKNKYRTTIMDNAFIGCNTNLVAPVTVGNGAYIAAGSTITDEVPEEGFAIARARQVNKENWKNKRKA